MNEKSSLSKVSKSLETIRNAAISVKNDIVSDRKKLVVSDFSILFGTIYPNAAVDPEGFLISPNTASSTTVNVYLELASDAPIELVIPPATIAEIMHSIYQDTIQAREYGNDQEKLSALVSSREKLEQMKLSEISHLIRKVPNTRHKRGIKNLVNLFNSPYFYSCIDKFGKEITLEAHRKSKELRIRLMQIFSDHRRSHPNEVDNFIRNWADADNLAFVPMLDESFENENGARVLYGGPIPTQQFIEEKDRRNIIEHQRNFVSPFLNLTLCKDNMNQTKIPMKDAITMAASNIERDCDTAIENLAGYESWDSKDLIPAQANAILRVARQIKYLKDTEGKTSEAMNEKKEEMASRLRNINTVRDHFMEHAEELDSLSEILFDTIPELSDDEMLDEFSLKEMRDSGKAPWLLPK